MPMSCSRTPARYHLKFIFSQLCVNCDRFDGKKNKLRFSMGSVLATENNQGAEFFFQSNPTERFPLWGSICSTSNSSSHSSFWGKFSIIFYQFRGCSNKRGVLMEDTKVAPFPGLETDSEGQLKVFMPTVWLVLVLVVDNHLPGPFYV